MSSSSSYVNVPTHRLRFLVEYGSSLAALHRKMTKEKDTKKNITIDPRTAVEDIKRLKEELKTAKQSLVPPSYSLDKRGGDKVIEKIEGIVKDLIYIDQEKEVFYRELLEELYEMKEDHRLTLDSQKQSVGSSGGGLSSSPSQVVLPFDDVSNNSQFETIFNDELSPKTRGCLLRCIPYAKICTDYDNEDDSLIIQKNVEISKGVWINWLIGAQILDDPLEGEQFLAELLEECSSFNLIRLYSSSKIIISPEFVKSVASLPSIDDDKHIRRSTVSLINVNKTTCKVNDLQMITEFGGIAHLGNFNRGMGHIVVEDTFVEEFERLFVNEKQITFLSFQGISGIQELPQSVCNCFKELRVLDLRSCQDLKSLPKDIGNLEQLICLDLSQCYQLDHIPKGIIKLKKLRVLLGFIVITDDNLQQLVDSKHQVAKFADLQDLKNLMKFTIRTRRMSFPTNQDLHTLHSMEKLRKLKVAWVKSFEVESTTLNQNNYDYTEGLPKTLEKLELQAAPDTTVSRLLGLISKRSRYCSLEKIYIRGGDLQKFHSNQHCFPHVKILRLRYLPLLHMNWPDFRLSFPNLSYLHITECPNLNFFPCDDNGEWIQSDPSM